MKMPLAAAIMAAMMTTAVAADATLATESKEAYDNSIVAMAVDGRGPDDMRKLIVQLLVLASAREALKGQEAFDAFKDDPERFLTAIRRYDGWTFEEIMAAR